MSLNYRISQNIKTLFNYVWEIVESKCCDLAHIKKKSNAYHDFFYGTLLFSIILYCSYFYISLDELTCQGCFNENEEKLKRQCIELYQDFLNTYKSNYVVAVLSEISYGFYLAQVESFIETAISFDFCVYKDEIQSLLDTLKP